MILSHPNLLEKGIFFLIQCINMRKKNIFLEQQKKVLHPKVLISIFFPEY